MNALSRSVLVVDDEFIIAYGMRLQVEGMDLEVCGIAATAEDAVALAQLHRPAVVLMDMRLRGEKDGVDAAQTIYETVGSRVIFITGSNEPSATDRIHLDHPFALLHKPVPEHQFKITLQAAMSQEDGPAVEAERGERKV